MKTSLLLLLSFALAGGSAEKPEKNAPVTPAKVKAKVPRYVPPFRGAPAVRVDGGSRGGSDDLPALMVVAPSHTGLTTQAQPTLVYYQSKPSSVALEFTLLANDAFEPLLETNVNGAIPGNFHLINLADHKASLAEGLEYRWTMAFVPDPNNRSKDLIASGSIKRVAPSADLSQQLEQSAPLDRPSVYGQAGIWYDAIGSLEWLIHSSPENDQLKEQRDALLAQVGLTNCLSSPPSK